MRTCETKNLLKTIILTSALFFIIPLSTDSKIKHNMAGFVLFTVGMVTRNYSAIATGMHHFHPTMIGWC